MSFNLIALIYMILRFTHLWFNLSCLCPSVSNQIKRSLIREKLDHRGSGSTGGQMETGEEKESKEKEGLCSEVIIKISICFVIKHG